MSSSVYINAVSIAAPGLLDWPNAQAVLRGEQAYVSSELPLFQPTLLPANERRRASPTVRMAFRVAEAATQSSEGINAAELASVFSSSDGDLSIAQRICNALAETARFVSPTDFHNSVHNAAAGYWSIASGSKGASTAISALDHSFAVGLMEALGMVQIEQTATLLVSYDLPAPQPLLAKRPLLAAVGVAMVLTPQRTPHSLALLSTAATNASASVMSTDDLEALRLGNPAARALPILQLLAIRTSGSVVLALPHDNAVKIYIDVDMRNELQSA